MRDCLFTILVKFGIRYIITRWSIPYCSNTEVYTPIGYLIYSSLAMSFGRNPLLGPLLTVFSILEALDLAQNKCVVQTPSSAISKQKSRSIASLLHACQHQPIYADKPGNNQAFILRTLFCSRRSSAEMTQSTITLHSTMKTTGICYYPANQAVNPTSFDQALWQCSVACR
jgi:hypothetical protein